MAANCWITGSRVASFASIGLRSGTTALVGTCGSSSGLALRQFEISQRAAADFLNLELGLASTFAQMALDSFAAGHTDNAMRTADGLRVVDASRHSLSYCLSLGFLAERQGVVSVDGNLVVNENTQRS